MSTSTNDIRRAFLDFFEQRQHQVVPSSPITPKDDPTLLFVNAGMAPLKDYFSGARTPPAPRLVSSQKCVRAGGKHNDLDNVGYTARHHTFFEMLGNFSFGDYFKPEAIEYAWSFLTGDLGIAKDRLYATVYHTDDEAAELWRKIAGLPDSRIIRIATEDNFWSMGDTGPCGPCSEIFYDHGDHVPGGPPGSPDEDGDRFVEVWNLVFMQFERFADGREESLPAPCIDTGAGLERVAAVMQGVTSNFDTDVFKTLIAASEAITGNRDPALAASHRVVADHVRTCAFLVAEGVLPSNEGRGYVLRRIMRRAMRHLNLLGTQDIAFHKLVAPLVDVMGEHYQELGSEQARIEHALQTEETQFRATLDRGMRLLERELEATAAGSKFSGEVAFRLYDTYGFPLDLTEDVLRAQNMSVDVEAFDVLMTQQRERARASWSGSGDTRGAQVWNDLAERTEATRFTGYDRLRDEGTVLAIVVDGEARDSASAGDNVGVLFDQSPFYAESGGQVGDRGVAAGDDVLLRVTDTQKPVTDRHAHLGQLEQGTLRVGDRLTLEVDAAARRGAAAHHSATHLMHAALREVLGDHVGQKGSYVGPDRLRFDFSHTSAVTPEQLQQIEAIVNAQVARNEETRIDIMDLDDALATGAMAMFDERYDDQVRVLSMGRRDDAPYSIELCGGTHVTRGGDIGLFKILSEASVGAGIRRIEAVTGDAAIAANQATENLLTQIQSTVKSSRERLLDDVQRLVEERKSLQNELKGLREASAVAQVTSSAPEQLGDVRFLGVALDGFGGRELKDLAKRLLSDNRADVVCLLSNSDKNTGVVVGVNKAHSKQTPAKELLRTALDAIGGGGGGGSPTMAQGATKAVASTDDAVRSLEHLRERLSTGA